MVEFDTGNLRRCVVLAGFDMDRIVESLGDVTVRRRKCDGDTYYEGIIPLNKDYLSTAAVNLSDLKRFERICNEAFGGRGHKVFIQVGEYTGSGVGDRITTLFVYIDPILG